MNVKEIVRKYLEDNGFSGLYNSDDFDCCCGIDDLMDCDEPRPDCHPGYRQKCDCGGGHEYHIGPDKEK